MVAKYCPKAKFIIVLWICIIIIYVSQSFRAVEYTSHIEAKFATPEVTNAEVLQVVKNAQDVPQLASKRNIKLPYSKDDSNLRIGNCSPDFQELEKIIASTKVKSYCPSEVMVLSVYGGDKLRAGLEKVRWNRAHYAMKYGYRSMVLDVDNEKELPKEISEVWKQRPPQWFKLLTMELVFKRHPDVNYIFYVDYDAMITTEQVSLDFLIHLDKDFVGGGDYNGFNSGIMFIRRSEWSLEMIRFAKDEMYPAIYHFQDQSSIFVSLLQDRPANRTVGKAVARAQLRMDINFNLEEYRKQFDDEHVLIMRQCVMHRKPSMWFQGALIAHASGYGSSEKLGFIDKYHNISQLE